MKISQLRKQLIKIQTPTSLSNLDLELICMTGLLGLLLAMVWLVAV